MKKKVVFICLFLVSVFIPFFFWIQGGFDAVFLNTDIARDLYELSNLWIGRSVIWLGPRLNPGLYASPIYYYLFYPALLILRGNGNSIIVFNLFISLMALALFSSLAFKKWGFKAIAGILVLGLYPWWVGNAMHPGNGYTYIYWLVISLTFLWFEYPVFLSTLFLGLSISFHPGAILALPIFIYEWYKLKQTFKLLVTIVVTLLLPWSPILLFEIITKGYIIRNWLANPTSGFSLAVPNMANIQTVLNYLGMNLPILLLIAFFLIKISSKRVRMWLIFSLLTSFLFSFFSYLPSHYVLGTAVTLGFIFVVATMESTKKITVSYLILILILAINVFSFHTPTVATRNFNKISGVVNSYIDMEKLDRNSKISVIASLDESNKVVNADDYRFFLRTKGYNVVDVSQYSEADALVMFIETPNFNWENWSTWEMEQFGQKKLKSQFEIQGIEVITFLKVK